MSSTALVQDFLAQKRFAIVGLSRDTKHFSRALMREMQQRGYECVPVNPEAQEIEGSRCFARVQDVQPPVDSALLMTSSATTDKIVADCLEAGIKRVWMYRAGGEGAVNTNAIEFCCSRGIDVVPGECPLMFLGDAHWFHRVHGWVRKITGKYPA